MAVPVDVPDGPCDFGTNHSTYQSVSKEITMDDTKVKLPPPVPVSVSIEGMSKDVSYLRRDVDEMKINHEKYHQELMNEIRKQSDGFSTKDDVNKIEKQVDDQEKRIGIIEATLPDTLLVKRLVFGCVTIILVAVFSALVYLVVHH